MNAAPDLLALVLRLRALQDGVLPATTGHLVHGAFMALLAQSPGAWDARLHNRNPQERPFTLSGLRGGPKAPGGQAPVLTIQAGAVYWFRLTSLVPDLSAVLLDLGAHPPRSLSLGGVALEILGLTTDHDRGGQSSYAALSAACLEDPTPPPVLLGLRFLSATTCRSQGRNQLFPLPGLIFPQLWRRWQLFAPPASRLPPLTPADCEDTLMVAGYHLQTRHLRFGPQGQQLGFTGYCEYRATPGAAPASLRLLHLLWQFSFFAGIGYGTPKGMGQVALVLP